MRPVAAAVIVALTALMCAGCAETVRGKARPSSEISIDDPSVLMVQALRVIFSWRPGSDRSAAEAFGRAAPYLTNELAEQEDSGTTIGAGAQWKSWASARARVTATVEVASDEHPPDTADRIERVVLITQKVTRPNKTVITTNELVAWVTAVNTPHGWRISAITF